jgi:hypothetical protein
VTEPVIHIHEDDWALRNLYPLATEEEVEREFDAADEAAERNAAPGGGFTNMHVIEAPSITYLQTGLALADAAAALQAVDALAPSIVADYRIRADRKSTRLNSSHK